MLEGIINVLSQISEREITKFAETLLTHKDSRIWIIGNGGSASTASHLAADLDSLGFDTKCLSDNTPRLTAIVNDFGWPETYAKQLFPLKAADVLIVISVHGGSASWSNNLVNAARYALARRAVVLSLGGCDGGEMAKISKLSVVVPSDKTYIIEGIHCVLTHVIRQKIEEALTCKQ